MTIGDFIRARLDQDETQLNEMLGQRLSIVDPRRFLRDVEAKRALLQMAEEEAADDAEAWWPAEELRLLAWMYADHPDWQPEWRPQGNVEPFCSDHEPRIEQGR